MKKLNGNKKKNRIFTIGIREIRTSFPRFISLFIMSLLGVFCFSGLQATAPDMRESLDRYLDEQSLYDIRIVSTMGLTAEDLGAIQALDVVDGAEGAYFQDVLLQAGQTEIVARVHSITTSVNQLALQSGRMPESETEIVVEDSFLQNTDHQLGDRLSLSPSDSDTMPNTLTIVGTVTSPLYFECNVVKSNHGKTSIGTGTVNYYFYGLPELFRQDYYTEIYITCPGAKDCKTSDAEYTDLVQAGITEIESITNDRQLARYHSVYAEAEQQIDEQEATANEELRKARQELDDADAQLVQAKEKLDTAKWQLVQADAQISSSTAAYQGALDQAGITEAQLDTKLSEVNAGIAQLTEAMKNVDPESASYPAYQAQYLSLQSQLEALQQLTGARDALASGKQAYAQQKQRYDEGLAEYEENLRVYEDSARDYEKSAAQAADEIASARQELADLTVPTWQLTDRTNIDTYTEFMDDADSIGNLSRIFPVVFFSVAVLISLISMNRMVEDDRGQIGTLKSLGFQNGQILRKYLLFSAIAVSLGGVLGALLGVVIIPSLIWNIYKILFSIPKLWLSLNIRMTAVGMCLSFLCICGTTVITVLKVIRESPAQLMRPKAPPAGKRVLLERLPFIWKHLNFSNKIIVRNISRYKKRVLVTVGGILGCTALMLCGFGLRDAIVDIPSEQFEHIFTYDEMLYLNTDRTDAEIQAALQRPEITEAVNICICPAVTEGYDVSLFVPEQTDSLSTVLHLQDLTTGEDRNLDNGAVYLSDKLAQLLGVQAGDSVTLTDDNDVAYTFVITGIVKNYLYHYVFLSRDTFEQAGGVYNSTISMICTQLGSEDERDAFNRDLLGSDAVLSVSRVTDRIQSVRDMLHSLNNVVYILTVASSDRL